MPVLQLAKLNHILHLGQCEGVVSVTVNWDVPIQSFLHEETFPLLDHEAGLELIQKEALRIQLKQETKEIMMHFYRVVSQFKISLTQRNVAVHDLRQHLWVLDAFIDDDKQMCMFLEQMLMLFMDTRSKGVNYIKFFMGRNST